MNSDKCLLEVKLLPRLLGGRYLRYINMIYSKKGISPKKFSAIRSDLSSLLTTVKAEEEILEREIGIIESLLVDAMRRYSETQTGNLLSKVIFSVLLIAILAVSVNRTVVANTSPQAELWYESALAYVQTFYQWIEVVNGAMQTINGGIQYMIKQADNNASAQFDLLTENYNKSQIARGTIAEKTLSYMEDQRKAWNRLANTSGSSVCIGDSAYGGYMGLRILDYEWADEIGDSEIEKSMLNGSQSLTSDNGKTVAALSATLSSSSASDRDRYLAKRSLSVVPDGNTVPAGGEEEESAKIAIDIYTGTPANLPQGSFKTLSRSEQGREHLGTIGARVARRDTAVKAVASETARTIGDSDIYNMILGNAENMIEAPSKSGDESAQHNERNAMLGRIVVSYLKEHYPDGVMSSNDTLTFMADLRLTSEYSEFIRSSGPAPTPLIRDVIHNQIVAMTQRSRQIELQEKSLAVLSSILLEIQDDPERIRELASQRSAALGSGK